jgi:hypothetical protein
VPIALGLLLLAIAPALAIGAPDSLTVRWSAPGDDAGLGTATAYDLRMSTSPINDGNFAQATQVDGMPAPRPAGTIQRVTIRGLSEGTTYFFAIKTVDDAGNWSPISNVASWDGTFDTAPPSTPVAPSLDAGTDGAVTVTWPAGAEADLVGYNVYRHTEGGPAVLLTDEPVVENEYVDSSPPQGVTVWYEITAVDASGNESGHSQSSSIHLAPAATAWKVEPAYPNPSHIGESVRFPVVIPGSSASNVRIDIVNSGGMLIRRLELGTPMPGVTTVEWDGRNDAGRDAAPGVYRGWLVAGDTRTSVRVLRVP